MKGKTMMKKKKKKKIGAPEGLLVMDRIMTPVPVPDGMILSDELVGYCRYRDGRLVPEDGDSYDIHERIDRFEFHKGENGEEDCLVVWERPAALELPVSEPWFSMIRNGEKKEEYREIKPYWTTRFRKIFPFVKNTNIPFENAFRIWIRLRNGYGESRPSFLAEVSLKRGCGKAEWGAEEGKEYYVLMVHAVCEEESVDHASNGVPKR